MGNTAAILDVDGTLVDTNYHHAIAWYRAFRTQGITLPLWRIHRQIGMGGDQLVSALAGEELERERGDEIREREAESYRELIEEVQPLTGARELIEELGRHVDAVVLASSAKQDEVDRYLDLLDARELVDAWTTSADVESTKPEPDLVHAALAKAGADAAVMIGDSRWDCEAASRAGVPCVGLLTGGFSADELLQAGAVTVFEELEELRSALPDLPLIGPAGRAEGDG
jgi:HAD superfamily hydrolase (TIGR01509 family)